MLNLGSMPKRVQHYDEVNTPFYKKWRLVLATLLIYFLMGFVWGQGSDAQTLLNEARQEAQSARQTYPDGAFNIDQPLWRNAINKGRAALELEPGNPDTVLFLAESYSAINWHIRAWEQWLAYLELNGSFASADHAQMFANAGTELGFARYERGDLAGALPFYQKINGVLPDDTGALTWLGRLYLEQGQTEQALPYWRRLSELEPNNESYAYYLDLSEEQQRVGAKASATFREGLRAYEAGDLERALSTFEKAIAENASFNQAYVWAGRTSLELGESEKAERYWQRVLSLDPDDERARYFVERSKAANEWGADAADAFYEGQQFYSEGDVTSAAERFDYAALLNPEYTEALAWTARSYQELEQPSRAIPYWRAVLELEPSDERAQYFLELAEQEEAYGGKAGRAFALGVEQFQIANLDEAERLFKEAVDGNPELTEAWAWLGRIYFTRADYSQAKEAYDRALELEPGNEDYRFFASEAAFLAGDDTDDAPNNAPDDEEN